MPDILANGDFGRDDGIKCESDSDPNFGCGGATYLVDDQGEGLRSYQCEDCDQIIQVQFDDDDDSEWKPEGWEEALWDERTSPV